MYVARVTRRGTPGLASGNSPPSQIKTPIHDWRSRKNGAARRGRRGGRGGEIGERNGKSGPNVCGEENRCVRLAPGKISLRKCGGVQGKAFPLSTSARSARVGHTLPSRRGTVFLRRRKCPSSFNEPPFFSSRLCFVSPMSRFRVTWEY